VRRFSAWSRFSSEIAARSGSCRRADWKVNARRNCSGRRRLEAEHGSDAALDAPVILLDAVVQILALADADRLERPPRSV
jgi:hypothetical protein